MAGIKWREEGERSTKFFLNALKSREAMAMLDYIQTENGPIVNQKDIMEYAKEFYEDLYAATETLSDNNFFKNCPKLSEQSFRVLENDTTLVELKMTLKHVKIQLLAWTVYRIATINYSQWNYSH